MIPAWSPTTGDLNLMSRFSLNSSLTLNTAATDSDTTSSSSTSGRSATNNSSSSLSLSPASERDNNNKFNNTISNTINNNSHNNIKPHHQASNHLLELQKEIKEEEDEIFANINSLINSRSNLYSTFDDDDDGDDGDDDEVDDGVGLDEETQSSSTAYNKQLLATRNNHNNNNNKSRPLDYHKPTKDIVRSNNSSEDLNDHHQLSRSADDSTSFDLQNDSTLGIINNSEQPKYDTHFHHERFDDHEETHVTEPTLEYTSQYLDDEDEQQQQQHQQHLAISHANKSAPYYDEEQAFEEACNHQGGEDQPDYLALKAVIQQVTNNLPKPCVFFLEGNCRRSDCKYSHDLSNITCKYWIEGFCFKGELCPFLHSYNPPSDYSLLDEDGLQSLAKKELNPTFVIESEADFPSLPLDAPTTASNEGDKSGINVDMLATSIQNQILSSNPAVVFKTVKKKRKRG